MLRNWKEVIETTSHIVSKKRKDKKEFQSYPLIKQITYKWFQIFPYQWCQFSCLSCLFLMSSHMKIVVSINSGIIFVIVSSELLCRFHLQKRKKCKWLQRDSNPQPLSYELSDCGFESRCSHLNFRYCACFEQGVPWHSGKYRV